MGLRRDIITNNIVKNLLPEGYIECEYLESTGTLWIDTNIVITDSMSIKGKIKDLANVQYCGVIGDYINESTNTTRIIRNNTNTGTIIYFNTKAGNGGSISTQIYNNVIEFYLSKDLYIINDIIINNPTRLQGTTNNTTLFIGKANKNSSHKGYIYYLIIKNNKQKLIHLIPALDPNNRPCMYDTVSKQPFYNSGTGEFNYKIK